MYTEKNTRIHFVFFMITNLNARKQTRVHIVITTKTKCKHVNTKECNSLKVDKISRLIYS